MKFIYLLVLGASLVVLVNPYPLVQNMQPFPITNYQHTNQPLCSEAFIQPSNIDYYSQPITVQNPVATYLPLPFKDGAYLTDQITQLVWDKIFLDPSLRKILDPKISCPQTWKDVQTNLHPYNTGGVVNNYIIVPPDYIKLNETVKQSKTNRINQSKIHVKENAANDKRNLTNNNKAHIKNGKSAIKQSQKEKHNAKKTWSFNTDNIKCFTPVDVLQNEKYQPERKVDKNKEVTKQSHKGNSNKNSIKGNCKNKNKSQKSKKPKTNKVRNKSLENSTKECRNKKDKNISSLNKEPKKTKQQRNKKESNICKCVKTDDKTKAVEDVPQFCEQDIEDLLLSILLQQSCPNLENRCTRNSKTDKAKKDPEIPGDISNTFNWYLNDLYSQQSLQQALNSNAFQGNKYPFDFSQIYQIPQYSNADVNKPKGNTGQNKNTRRKKKKKKDSRTKTRKKSDSNSDDINHSVISDSEKNDKFLATDTHISKINAETYETLTQNIEISTQVSETMSHTEKSTPTKNESTIKTNNLNIEIKPTELPPTEKITTETVHTTSITFVDKTVEHFKDATQHTEDILEDKILQTWDDNLEREEEDSKELYETQIPHSVIVHTENENNTISVLLPESEEKVTDEMLPISGFGMFNQHHGFGSEDEFFKMFMNDYYPDFRADNHAYSVNEEEEVRNIDERYFYVTDKNIDSREVYSPEEVQHQLYDKGIIYNEDNLQNLDSFKHNDDKDKVIEEDKSQEIVFRTPPGLDAPDFITRKINRDSKDSNEIYYQHDNSDNFENLHNFAYKSENYEPAKRNDSSGRIVETVYAKSKVVQYGQGQELIKSNSEPRTSLSSPRTSLSNDMANQNEGKTTVVIAKSLPEEFW